MRHSVVDINHHRMIDYSACE